MSQSLFNLTTRFKNAISEINEIDKSRFPLLLTRVAKKTGIKMEKIFSQQEEAQLQEVLKLSSADLSVVLEACTFIFEQAAYYNISGNTLGSQLGKTGLDQAKIEIFQRIWQEEAEGLVARLKTKTVSPLVLDEIGWRLHLHLSQSNLSKIKVPSAIFELSLKSPEGQKESSVLLEFNKDELQQFYFQLETMQDQLDNLS